MLAWPDLRESVDVVGVSHQTIDRTQWMDEEPVSETASLLVWKADFSGWGAEGPDCAGQENCSV